MSHYLHPLPGRAKPPVQVVINDNCIRCGLCLEICPAQAIRVAGKRFQAGKECIGCAACIEVCPVAAPAFVDKSSVHK